MNPQFGEIWLWDADFINDPQYYLIAGEPQPGRYYDGVEYTDIEAIRLFCDRPVVCNMRYYTNSKDLHKVA